MANIVKLQDDLKGIPLKNLIMYVQNPNGQVPSYLALAEIKRRKDMEQRATAQQNAPSHLSVAEELTAPRQNIGPQFDTRQSMLAQQRDQSGIANLSTGDMYNEKNFANGGIVAFADGGEANMNLETLPTLNVETGKSEYNPLNYMTPDGSGMYAGRFFKDMVRANPDSPPLFRLFSRLPSNMVFNKTMAEGGIASLAEGGEVQHFEEGGQPDTRTFGEDFSLIQRYITNLPSYLVKPFMERAAKTSAREAYDTITKNYPSMPKDVFADKKAGVDMKAPTTIPGSNVMGSQAAANNLFSTPYDPSQSLGYKGAPYKEPTKGGEPGVYDSEKVRSIGDYAKELQDYLGPDKNVALQRERLAKMEDRASRMERDAPYLALTEAGFGMMAGTSPFALTNIGTGAQMGLKSYAAAQDKFAALEEKRLNLVMNMDQAERREKVAVAEFGAKSKQAAEERNFKRQLQREHDKVLMAMNTDDNMKALMAAEIKNQPNITETLKVKEFVDANMPKEEKLILEDLGGNANKRESKNFSAYLDRMKDARLKLEKEAIRRPGVSDVSGSPVTTKRAKFLGFE
jgi:hypothetical protein